MGVNMVNEKFPFSDIDGKQLTIAFNKLMRKKYIKKYRTPGKYQVTKFGLESAERLVKYYSIT